MSVSKNKKNTYGFVLFHTLGWIFLALFKLSESSCFLSWTFALFCVSAVLALFFMLKQALAYRSTGDRFKSIFFFVCFFILGGTYIGIALKGAERLCSFCN